MNNPINPNHYHLKIEPIDYIVENNLSYCIGNVIKYVSRYQNKNGIEDLEKAIWYLQKQVEIEITKSKIEIDSNLSKKICIIFPFKYLINDNIKYFIIDENRKNLLDKGSIKCLE